MSIEKVQNKKGTVWRVRWRDEQGRPRARVLGRKADALVFDAETRRRKRIGTLGEADRGRERLSDFVQQWWTRYAEPNLAQRTRESYLYVWDAYIGPDLGAHRLIDITPLCLDTWVASLRARKVGESTIYRALAVLQGVMQRAVEWGELQQNPVRLVRKPKQGRARVVRAVPDQVIYGLLQHGGSVALVTAFMAYAGLRPAELRVLEWSDVHANSILIDKAAEDDGTVKPTKNYQSRTIPLRPELRPYLGGEGVVFGRASDNSWRAWVRRHWPTTAFPPYDLRHSYASRLIHEGHSIIEVAAWMGHDPAVLLRIYAHMWEEARHDQVA